MTLDVHHPSPADVDPLGEGLSARRCRQRASECDKSQRFHDDVFHGCSPFAFNSPARCPATSKITPSYFLLVEAQNFDLYQLREPPILTVRASSDVRLGSKVSDRANAFRFVPQSRRKAFIVRSLFGF